MNRYSKNQVATIPSVIDNKFYRKYLSNRQLERSQSENGDDIVNNRNIKVSNLVSEVSISITSLNYLV